MFPTGGGPDCCWFPLIPIPPPDGPEFECDIAGDVKVVVLRVTARFVENCG